MLDYVSPHCEDHFDFVIDDGYVYRLPDSPDRWPDVGNGAEEDPEEPPKIEYIPTDKVFIASQPEVREYSVREYAQDLINGDVMPPICAIKTSDGNVIVWNGHHRAAAHRLANKKTIPVRFWYELDIDTDTVVNRWSR
jgi:hypothetical protein